MDHILNRIFKTILVIFQKKKKHNENINNPSLRIYVGKIENRITFKIKTDYYLELLTPKTIKLLGNTKNEITKNKNCENAPHLEITEVVLVHWNIVNNDYQQDSRVLYTLVPNKKAHTIPINLKSQLQHGMINLNYPMDHILYRIFTTILSIF